MPTIAITNFSGRLTRIPNGDLNSGFAKFSASFGYDPFSKPGNLTWQNGSTSTPISGTSDLVLDGKARYIGENTPVVYLIGSKGNLYKVQINSTSNNSVHSIMAISSVLSGSPTYTKGASMEFFGNEPQIYIGSDDKINKINFDGTADAVVGSGANYYSGVYHPLKQFAGKLAFGNGTTIGTINASGTVTSSVIGVSSALSVYSEFSPPLPSSTRIQDLDTSTENNYLVIATSETQAESISQASLPALGNTFPSSSKIYLWNGSDITVTSAKTVSSNLLKSLKTYLDKNLFFTADSFGAALNQDNSKIFTLDWNKAPLPNAVGVNGNFIFWSAAERLGGTGPMKHALYYFGSLDAENPPGLYRVLSENVSGGGNAGIYQVPMNRLIEIQTADLNTSASSVLTSGLGTHYVSTYGFNSSGSVLSLSTVTIPNGAGALQFGVYETQTQLFSKRIGVTQIRVYIEPSVLQNSFQLDMIGSDGKIISNGTYTYTHGDLTDPLSGTSAVERINFNTNARTQYALGIRITNNGNTNMTFKKIEIDYTEEGR